MFVKKKKSRIFLKKQKQSNKNQENMGHITNFSFFPILNKTITNYKHINYGVWSKCCKSICSKYIVVRGTFLRTYWITATPCSFNIQRTVSLMLLIGKYLNLNNESFQHTNLRTMKFISDALNLFVSLLYILASVWKTLHLRKIIILLFYKLTLYFTDLAFTRVLHMNRFYLLT